MSCETTVIGTLKNPNKITSDVISSRRKIGKPSSSKANGRRPITQYMAQPRSIEFAGDVGSETNDRRQRHEAEAE